VKVLDSKKDVRDLIISQKAKNQKIGLVPTMGALHKGHLALVRRALQENDKVFVSVFVNPTQFDNRIDLEKYPRDLNRDKRLLNALSNNKIIIFAPSADDIYDEEIVAEHFDFDGLEVEMEGKFRTGHFDGVGTVVKRLFDIVRPDKAYFGEKDFQQLQIVKKLVKQFDLPVMVIGCEIYREENGLAMSSRNKRLKPKYLKEAPHIYKILKKAREKFASNSAKKVTEWAVREFAKHKLLDLEYFMIADANTLKQAGRKSKERSYRAFVAVFVGGIRLIDNIALN
jgi:pantoate--beta-alanine ligase